MEKNAPKLNQNYKQLTFKTEDNPKLLFRDDLLKTIKDISETNKVGHYLTPRYQPTLKREAPFNSKAGVISKEEGLDKTFNHIRLTNKGTQSIGSIKTLLCQTIST